MSVVVKFELVPKKILIKYSFLKPYFFYLQSSRYTFKSLGLGINHTLVNILLGVLRRDISNVITDLHETGFLRGISSLDYGGQKDR